jgi:hypothetical protein
MTRAPSSSVAIIGTKTKAGKKKDTGARVHSVLYSIIVIFIELRISFLGEFNDVVL